MPHHSARVAMHYTPPTTNDLARLKAELGLKGKEMAELFGVSGEQQWRKYTGGQSPRPMSLQMLFFAVARQTLSKDQIEEILERMRSIGATVDLSSRE